MANWIFAAFIFATVEGIIRYAFRVTQAYNSHFLCETNALSVTLAVTYIVGLSIGWVIVYSAKKHGRNSYEKMKEEKIEEYEEIANEHD